MRIVSGYLGGRTFQSPPGHRTHPMSERLRGALFSALGDIEGLTVLDAFSGTGALAFEAISRGAASVLAIEIDRRAQDTIKANIKSLGLHNKIRLISANCSSWSSNNEDARFDLVFAAPPYDDLQLEVVNKITKHVADDSILVLDWPGKIAEPSFDGFKVVSQKNYGDAQLVFYQKVS